MNKMFFIYGSPRSGTTLLTQCLDNHPEVVIPHETDFIIPLAFIFDRIRSPEVGKELITKIIVHSKVFDTSIGEFLGRETVAKIVADSDYHPATILNTLYAEIAEVANAKVAGDKSPNDLLFLRMFIKVGGITPETKILHIVRDIRDIMVSLKETKWVNDLDTYFPRFWSNSNLYLYFLYKDQPAQYQLIRYEDMARDPEVVLKKACRLLDIPFREDMMDYHKFHPRYRNMVHHKRLYNPISISRIGVYKDTFDRSELLFYEKQAREALEMFGYPMSGKRGLRHLFGKRP